MRALFLLIKLFTTKKRNALF